MHNIESLSSNPTLKAYAQGAAQSRTSARADFLSPTVNVASAVGKFKKYDAKHRFKIPDTKRSSGGEAAQVTFTASDSNYNCDYHAIDVPTDKIETDALEEMLAVGKEAMDLAADIATLSHERTVINAALGTLGAGTDYNFTSAAIDPVAIIDALIEDVIKATLGMGEIRVAFGPTAARLFKNNANVLKRVLKGKGQEGYNTLSIADYGSLLMGNPRCEMFSMVEDTEPEGKEPSYSFLLSDGIIVFAASQNPTRWDPSFMKTFRKSSAWMKPRFYQRADGRVDVAGSDWSEDVQITNSAAGKRINAKIA